MKEVLAKIELPIPKDGKDGVGIGEIKLSGDTIIVELTNGQTKMVGPLGFDLEMYGPKGRLVDQEWIPINGKLRLRQSVLGN